MQNISINNKYLCHNKSEKVIAFNLLILPHFNSPLQQPPKKNYVPFLLNKFGGNKFSYDIFLLGWNCCCCCFLMLSFLVFQSLNLFAWKDWHKETHNEANILIDGLCKPNVTCQSEHLIININEKQIILIFPTINWLQQTCVN